MERIVERSFLSRMACSFFRTVFLSFPDMDSRMALYTYHSAGLWFQKLDTMCTSMPDSQSRARAACVRAHRHRRHVPCRGCGESRSRSAS